MCVDIAIPRHFACAESECSICSGYPKQCEDIREWMDCRKQDESPKLGSAPREAYESLWGMDRSKGLSSSIRMQVSVHKSESGGLT